MTSRKIVIGLILGLLAWHQTANSRAQNDSYNDNWRQMVSTVGTLSSAQLYQCYLNICMLEEGTAGELYDQKASEEVLKSVMSIMTTVDAQLEKVSKLPLNKEDRETLAKLRKVGDVLRIQGSELSSYWTTADKAEAARHLQKYQQTRQQAWQAVSEMLNRR